MNLFGEVPSIEDRLADTYDAAGWYLSALDAVEAAANNASFLEAVARRDAALDELRHARFPKAEM